MNRASNPLIEPVLFLARLLFGTVLLLGAVLLLICLTAFLFPDSGELESHMKAPPVREAFTFLSAFALVVSATLLWGLQRPDTEAPLRLSSREGILRVALIILLPGGALFWGFLHFAT